MVQIANKQALQILVKIIEIIALVFIFSGTIVMLLSLTGSQTFLHDEAVYLSKARSWLEGTPANEFRIYRPIGMVAAGWVLQQIGNSEQLLRLFGVFFGAVTATLVYLLFKRAFGLLVALCVTVITVTSPLFMQQAPQFLNDIPSGGLLLGSLWLIYRHFDSGGKSKSIYFAAVLGALSFYLRYGVVSSLAIIVVATVFILAPLASAKKNMDYSKLVHTLILFGLLLVPHFIQSFMVEGSFLKILNRASTAALKEYYGEGFLTYLEWIPRELAGLAVGISSILGVLTTIVISLRSKWRQTCSQLLWLGFIGLLSFISVGFIHAEARYAFFPITLLSGIGIAGIYLALKRYVKVVAYLFLLGTLVGSLYLGYGHYTSSKDILAEREIRKENDAYIKAAEAIHKDSNGDGCAVWSNSFRSQLSWYSRCNTLSIKDVTNFERDYLLHLRKNHYSVVPTKSKEVEISPAYLEEYGIKLLEIFRTKIYNSNGELVVYRIDKLEFKTNANSINNNEIDVVEQFDKSQVEEVPAEDTLNQEEI